MTQPSSTSSSVPTVVKATLTAMPNGTPIPVHFNPSSLVYTVENSTQQQGSDPKRRQFAGQFTGKLSMDLQFDTTDTGVDVRQVTGQVALFMQSSASANKSGNGGANAPAPAVLSFEWGAYQFQGFMESFKETIDFFSADGIPLRALVSIGLARQDNVFDTGSANTPPPSGSLVPTSSSSSAASAAAQGGDPNAGRALASANGLENPRFTGGAALEVGGGLQLNAAAGFAASASVGGGIGISGGLGVSLSAGAGISAGAGVSAGASAGASVGASAGIGVSAGVSVSTGAGGQVTLAAGGGALFGSTASAGVPATAGAFAGLETGRTTVSTTAQLDPMRMLPATVGSDVAAGANASFGLGGVATAPSGFSTDVGASFSFSDRLTFDGD
ncbi:MAG: hypothetical protein ABSD30_08230 [Candidatus Binatus sp.]